MNLSDLGQAVAKYAPAIGAMLPLPGGAAIGTAIAQIFGGDIKDPEGLIWKINQDPQAAIKLAEIQNNLKVSMRNADIEELKATVDNTKNARDMWAKLAQSGNKTNIQENLAYILIIGTFIALLGYMFTPTMESKEIINAVVNMDMLMLGFFYGQAYVNKQSSISAEQIAQVVRAEMQRAANENKLDLPTPKFND